MSRATALALPLCLLFVACDGCDKKDAPESTAADAEVPVYIDAQILPRLGVELSIPGAWIADPVSLEASEKGLVLRAHRKSSRRRPALVAPRLFVTTEPVDSDADAETLLRRALDATKAALPSTQARTHRTTTSRWAVDGVRVVTFRLDYTVLDRKADKGREVVQQTLVAVRADEEGNQHELQVTATYVNEGDEALGREVDSMLRSLHFVSPEKQ